MPKHPNNQQMGAGSARDPMADPASSFIETLCAHASVLGLMVSRSDYVEGKPRLKLDFWPNAPLWLFVELDIEAGSAMFYGVIRAYGLVGDRSDYHEVISALWGVGLRTAGFASVRLIDIEHPVIVGEIWGRYLICDAQPSLITTPLAQPDWDRIGKFLLGSRASAILFNDLYVALGGDPDLEECDVEDVHDWADGIRRTLHVRPARHHATYSRRRAPNWLCYRDERRGVTVISFDAPLSTWFPWERFARECSTLVTENALLVRCGTLRNAIPASALELASKLVRCVFDRALSGRTHSLHHAGLAVVPTEAHLFCVCDAGIVTIAADCSRRRFEDERTVAIREHRGASRFLFSELEFDWTERPDPARYEAMILDLVEADPAVLWARQVGTLTERDRKRDIIADWVLPSAPWQRPHPDEPPLVRRRVVVQCKVRRRSVNLDDLPNIPVVLQMHDADAYLLVADERVTSDVVDFLTTVPGRVGFWANWWSRTQVEERLRDHPEIARLYSDIVTSRPAAAQG